MKNKEELAYSRALVPKYNTLYKIIIAILVVIIILLVSFYIALVSNHNSNNNLFSGEKIDYDINFNTDDVSLEREVGVTQMNIDYVDNCNYSICYPEIGIEEIDNQIYDYANRLKNGFINEFKSEDNITLISSNFDTIHFKSLEDIKKAYAVMQPAPINYNRVQSQI